MALSVLKKESNISLQYSCKEWELTLEARYGIDGEERMEVDNEPADQLPHKLHLKVRGTQGWESFYVYPGIQDDVRQMRGVLRMFMNSPQVIMKTVRCITCYLSEKDTHGIHLVPENEQLLITKVDEHEGKSTFSYRSDPESDIIFPFEHKQKFWLTSVLWLLSELAIEQFGQQG
ncbi:uncharacterized protein [Pocillopora verrucosa]|uniref:uncharacterized protein isoform X2 n=1 Tax=Pocillopora verrucosa TaxID=203993 RepID=UPI0033419678